MGFRVDSVTVRITVYVEFEGSHDIDFTFTPANNDDPALVALLAKWHEITEAEIRKEGPVWPEI